MPDEAFCFNPSREALALSLGGWAFYASAIKKDGLIVNAPTKLGLSLPSLGLETSFAQAIPSIVATNGG